MKDKENAIKINQSRKEEHYKKYSIASLVLGILSISLAYFFHISILCVIIAICFGVVSVKKGKKNFSIIGIVLGTIGIISTAIIAIKLLSFVVGSLFIFIKELFDKLKLLTNLN